MTYENIRDVDSCVKVKVLKGYIGRKQINEGLKEEYQEIIVQCIGRKQTNED